VAVLADAVAVSARDSRNAEWQLVGDPLG
jgi:hypothetical protein